MAIELKSFSELDQEQVSLAQSSFTQLMKEYATALDLRRGAISDLNLHLHALVYAAAKDLIDRTDKSRSIKEIKENPETVESDTIDAVFSNYQLEREEGTAATGKLTIVLNALEEVTISAGDIFTVGSLTYTSDDTYTARTTEDDITSSTDKLLRQSSNNQYSFVISVTADTVGESYNVARGTKFTPSSTIENFVTSYAETDFTGGEEIEPVEDLLEKLEAGAAVKGFSSEAGIDAFIRNISGLEDIVDISVVGSNNAAQRRYHSIFPIYFGGRVDVYVRTAELPETLTVTKTATLVEKTTEGGVWQFSITKDEAPGFYRVSKVVLEDSEGTGFEIENDVRSYNISDVEPAPDIDNAEEAAYSSYQTTTIRFLDTITDANTLTINSSTNDYDVDIEYMPHIDTIQNEINSNENGSKISDVLVKAAVPCFLSVNFTIVKKTTEETPDLDELKEAIASAVNKQNFTGALQGSLILFNVYPHLFGTQTVKDLDIYGEILQPNGEVVVLRDSQTIEVPDSPEDMVTASTVGFILGVDDIGISVETV